MATATATHRLVRDVPACLAGSGERQLRFDVVGDDGVDDLAVDPAVGREVDAHPIGRRRGNRHGRFDTDADEPGMVIEAALLAAERQQVGILDKRLLQPLAEAVGIKAGPPRLDNDIKVNRPQPGRSDRAWFSVRRSTASKMEVLVSSRKNTSSPMRLSGVCIAHRDCQATDRPSISRRTEATSADAIAGRYVPFPLRFQLCLGRRTDLTALRFEGA